MNLEFFKVHECPITEPHNQKRCPYYHSSSDKRRCTTKFNYGVEFCPHK